MGLSLSDLKTAAFGGFEKESVLRYLRQLSQEHDAERAKYEKELEELRQSKGSGEEVERLRQELEELRRAAAQPVPETPGQSLEEVGKISDTLQEQAKTLEVLLAENNRLQNEVDLFRAREEGIAQREAQAQAKAEEMLTRSRDECARQRLAARQEAQDTVKALDGKLAAMMGLSQEFEALCRKAQNLVNKYG